MKTIVVLDDVNDSEQIDLMGVKYFGEGSKIIVTSRDRQVLKNGGADNIHEVYKLKENDSLQLFSTFAFKLLNPPLDFQDLSNKFLDYAQGNPLALKVLGSKLYTKSRKEWESEVDKLKEYAQPKISHILRWSFDELDELEKNIFLDVACFLKGELKDDVENVLSSLYKGALCGISNLFDKCLLHIDSYRFISMHDMLEEMGKDIVCQVSKDPGKRSRLWSLKDLNQVLKSNEVNKSIEGIKLNKSRVEELLLSCPGFKNMLSLRYIHFYGPHVIYGFFMPFLRDFHKLAVLANSVDSVSLPDELRYLCWDFYPFKSLSSSFNPKNLAVLKLRFGHMEQLWNENYKDLVNLREIDVRFCQQLRKIPNLSRAINLQSLRCTKCLSLVELPRLNHLTSLKKLEFEGCPKLKKFPELPNDFSELNLSHTEIEEVPDSIQLFVGLRKLRLRCSRVENVSSNISKLEFLRELDLSGCKSLKTLAELPRYMWFLNANDCKSLEKVSFTSHNVSSFHSLHDGDYASLDKRVSTTFLNCKSLNQDSIKNIESNAMLQIQSLAKRWARSKEIFGEEYIRASFRNQLFCSFPGDEISGNEFEHRSLNSWLNLKITTPNGCRGSRFLAFAIGLVADLAVVEVNHRISCKYQLITASGEKFTSDCRVFYGSDWRFDGYHVLIMFSEDMIIIDNDYEEASFEFKIQDDFGREYEVKECGVLVFFVDAESYTVSGCDGM
ncbi:hypothetical protein F3Y22_tig00112249pilonHSYRG00140 [Hibiscus syriacus]|uniref:Uncharacterized protein n=2 Tax=Hibiscus syriacus TaxID=106335 RepID=A0A6A2X2Y3_HIBSY|nr:hypothetical protein F3Y22_tig00112249pilonHSYRG00140 [Hibiscus syriacus]